MKCDVSLSVVLSDVIGTNGALCALWVVSFPMIENILNLEFISHEMATITRVGCRGGDPAFPLLKAIYKHIH